MCEGSVGVLAFTRLASSVQVHAIRLASEGRVKFRTDNRMKKTRAAATLEEENDCSSTFVAAVHPAQIRNRAPTLHSERQGRPGSTFRLQDAAEDSYAVSRMSDFIMTAPQYFQVRRFPFVHSVKGVSRGY